MALLLILCSIILSTTLIEAASVANPNAAGAEAEQAGQAEPPKFNKVFNMKPAYVAHFQTDTPNKMVTIGLEAETTGYVGFGFSPDGTMNNAELIMGGVGADGKPYMGAYHVLDHTPRKFESNNWQLVHAEQNATHTTLLIHRPFTAGGHEIEAGEIFVIWSIGADDDTTQHHAERGSSKITLIPIDAENVVDVHGRDVGEDGDDEDKAHEQGSKRPKPKSTPKKNTTADCPPCDCAEDEIKKEDDHTNSNKSWWYSSSARREHSTMSLTIITIGLVISLFPKF